jgi:hypothetical protein
MTYSLARTHLRRRAAVAAVGLGTLLVLAPAAVARNHHPTVHGVKMNVRAANRALHAFEYNAGTPQAKPYFVQLKHNSVAAANAAAALYRKAHGPAARRQAADALALVAGQQAAEAQGLTSILGAVPAGLQAQIAQAISASSEGRAVTLGLLNKLLAGLPSGQQSQIASLVALNSIAGAQVPAQLAGMLGSGGVGCLASGAVDQALAAATRALQLGLASVGPALALAPASIQAQVNAILAGIPGLLTQITQTVQQINPCSAGSSGVSISPTSLISGITKLVGETTGMVTGLLGGFLPTGAIGTIPPIPAIPAVPGQISGLLSSVSHLLPFGLGSLLGLIPGL